MTPDREPMEPAEPKPDAKASALNECEQQRAALAAENERLHAAVSALVKRLNDEDDASDDPYRATQRSSLLWVIAAAGVTPMLLRFLYPGDVEFRGPMAYPSYPL